MKVILYLFTKLDEVYFREKNLFKYGNYWSRVCGFEIIINNESLNYNNSMNNSLNIYSKKVLFNQNKNTTTNKKSVYSILQKKHWVNKIE